MGSHSWDRTSIQVNDKHQRNLRRKLQLFVSVTLNEHQLSRLPSSQKRANKPSNCFGEISGSSCCVDLSRPAANRILQTSSVSTRKEVMTDCPLCKYVHTILALWSQRYNYLTRTITISLPRCFALDILLSMTRLPTGAESSRCHRVLATCGGQSQERRTKIDIQSLALSVSQNSPGLDRPG